MAGSSLESCHFSSLFLFWSFVFLCLVAFGDFVAFFGLAAFFLLGFGSFKCIKEESNIIHFSCTVFFFFYAGTKCFIVCWWKRYKPGLVVIHFVYLCVYLHVFNFVSGMKFYCDLLIEKLERVSPSIFRYKDKGNWKVLRSLPYMGGWDASHVTWSYISLELEYLFLLGRGRCRVNISHWQWI